MTSKEWVKNELSLSDDCLTTFDRIMLNKVLQDLERLEAILKIFDWGYTKKWCEEYIIPFKDYDEYVINCESDEGLVSEDEFETIKKALGDKNDR